MPWLNEGSKGYKEALKLYEAIVALCLPSTWVHYTQLLRAAASVVANVAEEIGRFSGEPTPDAARFFTFARGSLHEVGAFVDIAFIDGFLEESEVEDLKSQCIELSEMLFVFVRKQRKKR